MAGRVFAIVAALLAVIATPVTDAAMREVTDKLAVEVGAVRGIRLRGPLERRLVTREEARAQVEAAVTAALSGSDLAGEERVLQRLGLLPAGSDYARRLVAAYGANPSGGWDPGTRRLSVPDWLPLDKQQASLAHELAHAATDQRFGLRRLLQIGTDGHHRLDHDAERARQALIEGDATVVALELADARGAFLGARERAVVAERMRQAAGDAGEKVAEAKWDPWIRTNALFAQVDGFLMVANLRARQSWSAVDALWDSPPASTEQVLHPEKLEAREAPLAVEPAPVRAFEPAFRAAGSEVLGELGVRAWLRTALPAEIAERAAAGWGGDRAVVYAPPAGEGGGVEAAGAAGARDAGAATPAAEPALAWLTVWDDVVDAEDFARSAPAVLARLAGVPAASVPAPDEAGRVVIRAPGTAASGGGAVFALAWRREAVALVIGAPAGTEVAALAEVLDGWKRPGGPGTGGAGGKKPARARPVRR